jgi:spore coat polysaccharide biosynthesis predicted glycosyltransferase SpsG
MFRADASHALGLGHVARLCALVEELGAAGHEPVILFGGDRAQLEGWLGDRGISAHVKEQWTALQVLQAALDLHVNTLVIDGAAIADELLPKFATQRAVRTVLVDDRGHVAHRAGTVINHNFHAPGLVRTYNARTLLLGRRYAMLRKDIRRLTRGSCRPASGKRLRVVVTFGGSDPVGATARTLRLLPADRPLDVVVIAGPGFRDDEALGEAVTLSSANGHAVDIHRAPSDPGALFVSADAAITSAGGTLGELAFLGCPALAYAIADDQVVPAAAQACAGLIAGGRAWSELDDLALRADLSWFLSEDSWREELRRAALATVDADGPKRIVEQLG